MDATEEYNQKLQEGWVLYYSEEGYPYYYRESTGESEWAQVYDGAGRDGEGSHSKGGDNEEASDGLETASDDSGSESEDESESDETEGTKSSGGQRNLVDKEMEARFLEFLKTPEGIAAAEAELQRIGRKVEKRQARQAKEVDKEYVRNLASKKKDQVETKNVYSLAGITGMISDSATSWMFPANARKKTRDPQKGDSASKDRPGSAIKHDDFNTKQRHRHPKNTEGDGFDRLESGAQAAGSPISSRSSSISSETDSFSSDDSDVEQIDAPLWSELPAWATLAGLTSRWFQAPANEDEGRATTEAGDATASPPATSSSAVVPFLPATMLDAAQLQTVGAELASRSFQYVGGAFVQAFGLLFERLNPLLEDFVARIVDAQLAPPNTATRPASNRAALRDHDAVPPRDQTAERQQQPKSARAGKSASTTPRAPAVLSARSGAPPPYPTVGSRSARSTPRLPVSPRSPPAIGSSTSEIVSSGGAYQVPAEHVAQSSPPPAVSLSDVQDSTTTTLAAQVERGDDVPQLLVGEGQDSQTDHNAPSSLPPASPRSTQDAVAVAAAVEDGERAHPLPAGGEQSSQAEQNPPSSPQPSSPHSTQGLSAKPLASDVTSSDVTSSDVASSDVTSCGVVATTADEAQVAESADSEEGHAQTTFTAEEVVAEEAAMPSSEAGEVDHLAAASI